MSQEFFIGIDGGASKCRAMIQNSMGEILAKASSGPANIAISVEQAWHAIETCVQSLLSQTKIKSSLVHLGIGVAGCELVSAVNAFAQIKHPYASMHFASDAHMACLGAHAGNDGAIIVVGTGSVGYQISNKNIYKVGGWGFPYDDAGSGAWIGLQALKHALRCLDGREMPSDLARDVTAFAAHHHDLISWAQHAMSTQYAQLAPLVIDAAERNQPQAKQIMQQAASEVESIATGLARQSGVNASIALVGGVAPYLKKYLSHQLLKIIVDSSYSAEEGAILFAKDKLKAGSHT